MNETDVTGPRDQKEADRLAAEYFAIMEKEITTVAEDERKGLPSASGWRRNELCAGSHQLSQEARRLGQEAHSTPSAASARGDRIHAAGEGEAVELKLGEDVSLEFLEQRTEDQVARIFGSTEGVQVLVEERFWLEIDGHKVASGRADRVYYKDETALVVDWKTGWSEPDPAEQNSQLKVLSVLVGLRLPHITKVIAQIISGPFGVTETTYDLKRLGEAYIDIHATLRKINNPHATFSPSEEACRYCPAINICPAVAAKREAIANIQFFALPDCNEAAAELLETIEIVANNIEQVRAYYRTRIEENPNYKIPGWALVPGAPRRVVSDWVAARSKLEEFVSAEALDALATFSIQKVEKLLGEAIGQKGEKLKEQFRFVLGEVLEEKYPTPSLKRVKGQPQLVSLTE